jgi:hypothetical protein
VIGVNAAHYARHGFGPALAALTGSGRIGPVGTETVPIYDRDGHPHADDRAQVLHFRKT